MKTWPWCAVALAASLAGCAAAVEESEAPSEPAPGGASMPAEQTPPDSDATHWITVDADRLARARADMPAAQRDALAPVTEQDGVAVVRAPKATIADLSRAMHATSGTCGGFMAHADETRALDALRGQRERRALRPASSAAALTIDSPEAVARVQGHMSEPPIADTIRTLSAFQNRYYDSDSGVDAAEWIAGRWSELAAGRDDVTVTLVGHRFLQPSVEMRIEGTTLPDEYVVIGGHLDSIGSGDPASMVAPGADDDASGIAAITEIARALFAADFRPERTVLLYGYAAEEVGLRGSQDIAGRAAQQGLEVIGVLQLDMTLYQSPLADIQLISDFTDRPLTEFVKQLIDAYLGATYVEEACGYACSDHASWHQAGFPAAFPFEAPNADYNTALHTVNDTLAFVSDGKADHALLFARLGGAFVVELAKGSVASDVQCDADTPCASGFECSAGACVPTGTEPPVPGEDPPAEPGAPTSTVGGCAASGSHPGGAAWLLLVAAIALRRRRRASAL